MPIANNSTMNTHIYVFWCAYICFSIRYIGVELMGCWVCICLISAESVIHFLQCSFVLFYTSVPGALRSCQDIRFLIFATLVSVMVSHSSNFHFSHMNNEWTFSYTYQPFGYTLVRCLFMKYPPFSQMDCLILIDLEGWSYFLAEVFCQINYCKYLPLFCGLFSLSSYCIFW